MVFFTKIDDRAKVKGSRDPLGIEPIWSAFGREVIGNLTTVTTSLRSFTTILLGIWFADRIIERGAAREEQRLALFLRAEQLIAYSRLASGTEDLSGDLRGIERVKARLANEKNVTISEEPTHQILSDQRTYGLWGLYSQAARKSGLLDPHSQRLTPYATEFMEKFHEQRLRKVSREIEEILAKKGPFRFDPSDKHALCAKLLAEQHAPHVDGVEGGFYLKALVEGGEGKPLQRDLWQTMVRVYDEQPSLWGTWFGMIDLSMLTSRAEKEGRPELAERLSYIRTIEPILGVSARLFGYLMRCGGRTVKSVAADVRKTWGRGLLHLNPGALPVGALLLLDRASSMDARERIVKLGEAMCAGHYEDAIHLVLQQNQAVMQARGGAPWIKVEGDKLSVRFRGDDFPPLPSQSELRALWVNSYFLGSLKAIGRSLREKA